ncbi:uncharacterized protein LOC121986684 [Zingiber officinale]|uniref:uncharacterized protein LOC121986684 n=1 Tax=Zingiber officinale TaxID=94328 RepID=UPI001C4B51D4|nr:uncharacterized protein LOC121986684 [Zingiber officinale]
MNSPLGRVLLNPEASGRLIKWTNELSEFDIQYQPHTAIKSQSLADFITEAARHVGANRVLIYSDSQLAAQQLSGAFEINNARLKLYAEAFEKLKANFYEVVIQKIPRAENQTADELAKLASAISPIVIQQPIEQVSLVAHIDRMESLAFPGDWRTTIMEFLRSGAMPSDQEEARLLRRRAGRFTLIRDQLYKKSFSHPLLKCVSSEDAKYILKEMHHGSCGGHPGGCSLARKILLAGYFWLTLQEDAARTVATCLSCQKYHIFTHRPTEEMKESTVSYPFNQWGMDIVGPFLMATEQRKVRLDRVGGSWVDELPGVLWVIRTSLKEGTGVTPFHLVYGGEAVVPVEVRIKSDRVRRYDKDNAERRQLELDLIEETRAKAVVRLMAYQQRMKQNYNRRVIPRAFQVGDLVWKKVKPIVNVTKLEAPWVGPFKVIEKLRSGAYYLEDEDGRQLERPWSANHQQLYQAG